MFVKKYMKGINYPSQEKFPSRELSCRRTRATNEVLIHTSHPTPYFMDDLFLLAAF